MHSFPGDMGRSGSGDDRMQGRRAAQRRCRAGAEAEDSAMAVHGGSQGGGRPGAAAVHGGSKAEDDWVGGARWRKRRDGWRRKAEKFVIEIRKMNG